VTASRRTVMLGGALGALALRVAAQTPRSSERGTGALPANGQPWPLPDEVQLLGGGVLRPVHDRSKVLVLYWWASWCPFCALQSPLLDAFWVKHRNSGLQMLGLSIDKRREDASAYLQAKGFSFASTWVTPEIERAMPRPRWLPVTVVLGRDGRVLTSLPGQSFPEDIEDLARFL
jgi:thiol-disulfide isomerase/thioredoxin